VSPVDELPAGVPASASTRLLVPVAAKPARPRQGAAKGAAGRFRGNPEAAREAGRKGAQATLAKRTKLRALDRLGLGNARPTTVEARELWAYLDDAERFAVAEIERLAASVGGGFVPPNVSSIVQSAAIQLAGSRMAAGQGKVELASRLANDSRQNLLAAHELCAREAKARPRAKPAWQQALDEERARVLAGQGGEAGE